MRGLRVFGLPNRIREYRVAVYVSVPLRGLRVFGPCRCSSVCRGGISFRPLAGITGLRTSDPLVPAFLGWRSFRPLAGITGLRTPAAGRLSAGTAKSFRPLAGITGLRTGTHADPTGVDMDGFRPLAGITGLRTHGGSPDPHCGVLGFPSPCGDYGSSDLPPVMTGSPVGMWVSVPLRGLRVFGHQGGGPAYGGSHQVSVPLRGLRVFGPLSNEAVEKGYK